MSKKKPVQPKLKPHWAGEEAETEHWAGRIDRDILSAIKSHAHANRRTIGGQINVALDEWLKSFNDGAVHKIIHVQQIPVFPGTSEPPARIKQQAAAHAKTLPEPDKLAEIAMSDDGWEGSNPKTLLADTKTKA